MARGKKKGFDKKVRTVNKGQSAPKKISTIHQMVEALIKDDTELASKLLHERMQQIARRQVMGEGVIELEMDDEDESMDGYDEYSDDEEGDYDPELDGSPDDEMDMDAEGMGDEIPMDDEGPCEECGMDDCECPEDPEYMDDPEGMESDQDDVKGSFLDREEDMGDEERF